MIVDRGILEEKGFQSKTGHKKIAKKPVSKSNVSQPNP